MNAPAHDVAAANRRGILFMLTAVAMFVCGDACMKFATQSLTVGQSIAMRSVMTLSILVPVVAARRGFGSLRHAFSPLVVVRSSIEALVVAMFVTTLTLIGLGEATVFNQTAPLIITALAALIYKEKIGWRRWTATVVGFSGVVLIARPSPAGIDWPVLLALCTAFMVAVRDLVTRRIPGHVPTEIVAFATALFALPTALALAVAAGEAWRAPGLTELAFIAGAAFFSNTGNLFMIGAFRGGEISVISPFRYVVVIYALTLGYVFFGEVPDLASLAGVVLIVGSGLYTLHRERVRAAEALRKAAQQSEQAVNAP